MAECAAALPMQFRRSGLDRRLEDLAELVFIDAPNAASGPPEPEVQPFFEPPYYEWWNFLKASQLAVFSGGSVGLTIAAAKIVLFVGQPLHSSQ